MLHRSYKCPPFFALTTLILCSMALSACGLQPAIVDEPKAAATPVTANVPAAEKDGPSKSTPEPGAEATLAPGEFTYANGVPFPVPSTEANPIRITTMEEAWGTEVKVEIYPTLIDSESSFQLRAVDEEGRFIVGEVTTGSSPTSMGERSHLAIMDLQTRGVMPIPNSNVSSYTGYKYSTVAVNDDWVIWLSNSNNIRAYNRNSANLVNIGMNWSDRNLVPDSYMTGPAVGVNSIDRSIVVWAEPSEEVVKGKVATVIKSYNLETGETAEVGKYGVRPVISWPYIAWLEPDLASGIEGEYVWTTMIYDLQTGETRRLNDYWSVRELAAYDDVIGYVAGITGFLENIDQTRRQVIKPEWYIEAQKLTINDRLVAWAYLYTPAVWDRKLEEVVRLPGVSGFSGIGYDACIVNGHVLAWQSGPSGSKFNQPDAILPPEDVKIYVLDTRLLP